MNWHWWTWFGYSAIFLLIGVAHGVWFAAVREPEIGLRFGAAVICLGIVVTARPFFRTGLRETVDRQLPPGLLDAVSPSLPQPHSDYASLRHLRWQKVEHKRVRPGIVHDVVAERVIGVALILLGTFVHGYGDLPLRWIAEE
ncbi:hypothetical protein [Methylocystis parvus]|uniref:Uncharacterized protein n=1 Tax=Methylocystis parvus TaxID=134 RepID=A0A6B8MB18_9HYPH|nr:hypothetical protein [Methylocystis parvus]QGM99901.1 hypothetical protein F7D14_20085 [Methylocystis parvus]WBK02325.1 hypothetical protein MMG94_19935 [Methylocystis parvus OBBP]